MGIPAQQIQQLILFLLGKYAQPTAKYYKLFKSFSLSTSKSLFSSKPFIIDRLQTDVEVHLSPNDVRILPCMTPISETITFAAKNDIVCKVGKAVYTLTFNDVINQSENVTCIRLQFLYDNHQLKAKLDFIESNEKIIAQREFKLYA